MDAFGKTRPLAVDDFGGFEQAFGGDPLGNSKRVDEGEEGRFRCFSRDQIKIRNDNLDIAWLRDDSDDPEDELTESEELAAAIANHLRVALEEIDGLSEELGIEEAAGTAA
jgi:type I restriction enzyme M protein